MIEALPAIDDVELAHRWRRLRAGMHRHGAGVLIVANPPDLQYVTGFTPSLSVSSARPWFAVLGLEGQPVIGCAGLAEREARLAPSRADVLTWASPEPEEGKAVLLDAVTRCADAGAVAVALGDHTRLGFPAGWLKDLAAFRPECPLLDAGFITWPARIIKSTAEIAYISAAASCAHSGFSAMADEPMRGWLEKDVARFFTIACLSAGADQVGYVAVGSAPNGYPSLIDHASDRRLCAGDVLGLDAGVRVRGYWCDFNRNFAISKVSNQTSHAARALASAAQAAVAIALPGRLASEVWHAMADDLRRHGFNVSAKGRMGHGCGLEFTEPPSLAPNDHTPLATGMVLCIEPTITLNDGVILAYEDMVAICADHAKLLTKPQSNGLLLLANDK
jgi:Xaa-Pro aminopeptidase